MARPPPTRSLYCVDENKPRDIASITTTPLPPAVAPHPLADLLEFWKQIKNPGPPIITNKRGEEKLPKIYTTNSWPFGTRNTSRGTKHFNFPHCCHKNTTTRQGQTMLPALADFGSPGPVHPYEVSIMTASPPLPTLPPLPTSIL